MLEVVARHFIFQFSIFFFFLLFRICTFDSFLMRLYVLNIKYIIGLLVIKKSKQKFTVLSVMSFLWLFFSFFRSFLGFFNIIVRNLFQNIVNYISENLPVPVKYFCDSETAKQSTHMIIFTKKNLCGKCSPCFSFTMTMDVFSF